MDLLPRSGARRAGGGGPGPQLIGHVVILRSTLMVTTAACHYNSVMVAFSVYLVRCGLKAYPTR